MRRGWRSWWVGLPKGGAGGDLVSIADAGFGVSQILPVLVGLLTARSGQLVYVEQPELHLHPKAQQALAGVLAAAAQRGVRVVAETHSSLLLLAVQTLVVEGNSALPIVILHWFQRDAAGRRTSRAPISIGSGPMATGRRTSPKSVARRRTVT